MAAKKTKTTTKKTGGATARQGAKTLRKKQAEPARKRKKPKAVVVVPEVMDPVRRMRGPAFDARKADLILVGLAGGDTLTNMCGKKGFPTRKTVTSWLLRGVSNEGHDLLEFAVKYKLAGDIRALLEEDEYLQTIKNIQTMSLKKLLGGESVRLEMVLDAMKWYLSKFRNRRTAVDGLEEAVRRLANAVGNEGGEGAEESGPGGWRFVVHKGESGET